MAGFVCIYYGNTGSSWLLSALAGAHEVWMPGFEPIERWAWDVDPDIRLEWLEKALTPPADRDGEAYRSWLDQLRASPQVKQDPMNRHFRLTCLKMSDLAVTDTQRVIDIIDRTGSKVIHLVRDNRLKHALSLYRYHDEQKSQFGGQDKYAPTKVDFIRFEKWVRESTRLHEQAMTTREICVAQLGDERVFPLSYEEFLNDAGKRDVLARLADFLGITDDFSEGKFSKATPDSLREAISNYPTFWLRHRFSHYRQYLD
ncbi:MAG: hypothetical protein R3246_10965 [Acidimicrobiia bacterium]|nr:hypothetical protein [Acidimicrobiia bacterium]